MTNPLLRDLYGHQAWADATSWRAIAAHPAAREDKAIRDRLHHIAIVQRAFLWVVGDRLEQFAFSKPEDFPSLDDLKLYVRDHHERLAAFIAEVSDARLDESIAIPWFQDPPLTITVAEALMQGAMHSQYHRGQNATRLREVGGEPPTTDMIVWIWQRRPAAEWDS